MGCTAAGYHATGRPALKTADPVFHITLNISKVPSKINSTARSRGLVMLGQMPGHIHLLIEVIVTPSDLSAVAKLTASKQDHLP
jgi:hypothetical protein